MYKPLVIYISIFDITKIFEYKRKKNNCIKCDSHSKFLQIRPDMVICIRCVRTFFI